MNSLQFFKTKREVKFDVCSGIGIVRKLFMIAEAVILLTHAQGEVPFQSLFFPVFIPFDFFSGPDKELHFHLFKFPHSEDKLAGHYFISKSFSYLCNSKRDPQAAASLNIQEIHKNSLSSFRSQVKIHSTFCGSSQFGSKH